MPDDFVGLQIDGPGTCGALHPVSQRPCVKPAGHLEQGDFEHNVDLSDETADTPTCPDCGNHMTLEFSVVADDEEVATRVFISYQVLKNVAKADLLKLLDAGKPKGHLHWAEDDDCNMADECLKPGDPA